ncbi:hypothetical protein [Catalinimonas niigatensis]|uniref:hypothetical protein n=1 Tax=Catalinimonas niigatensis TaxID=1397264 RepID=UPI002666F76E|nr:hypothetical protein [Catalinimonas niigatensis]WPP49252.1 hypothetical protein PZB72_21525 [Catalinimonas niigatensis]
MNSKSDSSMLEAAELAVSAMQQESVRLMMEAYGLTPERKQQGESLISKAKGCQKNQAALYDDQWSLSQQLKAQMDAVQAQFKEHGMVCRTALRRDPALLHSLKVNRFAKEGWPCIRQAAYFYTRVLEQQLNLQPYGVSKKEVEQVSAAVSQLLSMKEERTLKKGRAESCTQQKNAAFKALRQWVSDFRTTARMAYRDDQQMLEAFGILVLSSKKKRKESPVQA